MKIQEEIARLTATLQALTNQRLLALREGRRSEADQIASVQVDIDCQPSPLLTILFWLDAPAAN